MCVANDSVLNSYVTYTASFCWAVSRTEKKAHVKNGETESVRGILSSCYNIVMHFIFLCVDQNQEIVAPLKL
jgi:hypothetical protein